MFRCLVSSMACLLLLGVGLCLTGCRRGTPDATADEFLRLMNAGKNYLEQGDAANALITYRKAAALVPNDADVHLNLANAHLLNGEATEAIREADEVMRFDPNSAAAYFVKGSAHLRLLQPEEAVKALENSKLIDPGETATFFQLGLARSALQQWEEAIAAFREGLRLDPNRLHSSARYLLARALLQVGRQEEAEKELQLHQASAGEEGPTMGAAVFERCKFTRARVPFKLDQPDPEGIHMKFVDATAEVLGASASSFSGPAALIDVQRTGQSSLFAHEPGRGFRLLLNTNGTFHPAATIYPTTPDASFAKVLVGDLQNDRMNDIIVLGQDGSLLFQFETNGMVQEVSALSQIAALRARDGLLIDLDFTGKLDLVAVTANGEAAQVYRQFGPLAFTNITATTGLPATLDHGRAVTMEDWNRDQNLDLIVSQDAGPPQLFEKQRGGGLTLRQPTNWVDGAVMMAADFDNDLRPDLAVVNTDRISVCYQAGGHQEIALGTKVDARYLLAVDHDNDGWLDLWLVGETLRAWRNAGRAGFQEQTSSLGLDTLADGSVAEIHFADFDLDCDSDVMVALADGGLRYGRNEGGNANAQVKVNLVGNRSNASGLGCRVEIETGGLRLTRTVHQLPVEIGVGDHRRLDSFLVHWFNWPQGSADMPIDCQEPLFALELTIQEGSCPYLYAWDGAQFRFVTDFLGSAPLGLPVAHGKIIESDPEELIWIGDEQTFRPRAGGYQLQLTEELREVLYLDEAKLVVVDREPDTEVHPTDKLLPGGPFSKGTLWTLHREHHLRQATRLDGRDVTDALRAVDDQRVSPPRLRSPQLRGLAEPHGLILDFGPLDTTKPLVLVMNGWLRFGGGMANIAASHDPTLPFPFPRLEMEISPETWQPVEVTVGAPSGKTKTILVDLEDKLETGTGRLRLSQAFEIHWDRIALLEKKTDRTTSMTYVPPSRADLHFRGFSALRDLPSDHPITPDYGEVSSVSYWTIIPEGWCTRYGDVTELIAARDEGLALINSGDELTLEFAEETLPPKPAGTVRDFFLYVDGWDKDSDFHVITGTSVEPLPFHGMDDQQYGQQPRPPFPSDRLHRAYNTRWVDGRVIKRTARR